MLLTELLLQKPDSSFIATAFLMILFSARERTLPT